MCFGKWKFLWLQNCQKQGKIEATISGREKIMLKKLTALCCAVLICLAGCGKDPLPGQTEPSVTAGATEWTPAAREDKKYEGVSLKFQSCWQADWAESAVLTQAAELFRMTTGANVQIEWMPEYYEDGDIFQMPGVVLGSSYRDRVFDLTDLAQAAGYESKSIDALRQQVIDRSGKLNAIVQVSYVTGFYYNADVFDDCGITGTPRTYSEFLQLSKTLKDQGYNPMTMNTDMAGEQLMTHVSQYLGTQEAQTLVKKGGWTGAQAQTAVSDIWNYVSAGYLAYTTPAANPGGQNRIALSDCAMIYGSSAMCGQVEADTVTSLRWGMFAYPGIGSGESVISVDADVLAISASCQNPQAAFDFLMLLTTGEFDQLRADVTNGIPADPNNTSPIRGALEALSEAQTREAWSVEFSEKQENAIIKLWQGKYQEEDGFSKAMDRLSGGQ